MLSTLTLILNIFSLLLSCQPSGVQIDRWIEIKVTRSCSFSYIVTLVKNFFTSTYSRQLFCPPAAFLPTLKLIVDITNPAFLIDCANCLACLKFLQEMHVTFSTKKKQIFHVLDGRQYSRCRKALITQSLLPEMILIHSTLSIRYKTDS